MKRFIRYLYEYEQGKRLRNVGFVKVEQQDKDCTLNIHGKGLHMKGERKLDLYLFFEDGGECIGILQGTVDNVNPAINYRLYFTEEDVIAPENFQRINGIILESETGRKYAAVWNEGAIDVSRMRVLRPAALQKEEVRDVGTGNREEEPRHGEEGMREEETAPGQDAMSREMTMPGREDEREEALPGQEDERKGALPGQEDEREEALPGQEDERQETIMAGQEAAPESDESEEGMVQNNPMQNEPSVNPVMRENVREKSLMEEPVGEGVPNSEEDLEMSQELTAQPIKNICGDAGEPMPKERFQCTKIQRNDIARLPRCEWKWANNSFLLHGYYNYHHLAIIHDGEKYRLGVPGIYHPQEAKAASTFGFTEFIPYEDMNMDLTDDEKSSQERFGYWCRPIKRMLKM